MFAESSSGHRAAVTMELPGTKVPPAERFLSADRLSRASCGCNETLLDTKPNKDSLRCKPGVSSRVGQRAGSKTSTEEFHCDLPHLVPE